MSMLQNTRRPKGFGGRLMVAMMNHGHAPLSRWGLEFLRLQPEDHILDLGCGGGANLRRMLARCPKGIIRGLDYSEVSVAASYRLNRAAIQAGRCDVLQGDVSELPFSDESFDAVTAFETIYFWPDLPAALDQILRVLKPQGTLLLCNEADGKNPKDEKWVRAIEGMTLYSAEDLQTLLRQAGFVSLHIHTNTKHWLALTAKKPG